MDRLRRFFINMDRTAARTIGVTLVLLILVIALLVAGRSGGFMDLETLQAALVDLRTSGISFPIVVLIFCIGAFLGAPQFGLFAAVVAAFGPWQGAIYSWGGTMISSALTFWVGRLGGETAVRRYGGAGVNALSAFVGRNAFTASAVIRLVPTAPFILVNMAFGASSAGFLNFLGGTAIGIVPKIAVVAFAGQTVFAVMAGRPWLAALALAMLAALWLSLAVISRRYFLSRQ